ncbi:MAG: hypothetical protein QM778_33720 [Myxococcales bacterium]
MSSARPSRMLVALSFALVGCGGDDAPHRDAAVADQPSDGGPTDSGPACDLASVRESSGYHGTLVWKPSDLEACNSACPELKDDCVQAHCDQLPVFEACVDAELTMCVTASDGPCRANWESLICCAVAQCAGLQGGELQACLGENCSAESDAFASCRDAVIGEDPAPVGACVEVAQDHCLIMEDAGAPETSDAGSPKAAGAGSELGHAVNKAAAHTQVSVSADGQPLHRRLIRRYRTTSPN